MCLNQAQLIASLATLETREQSVLTNRETEKIPGRNKPVSVFKSYPKSLILAMRRDNAVSDPELKDVGLESTSVPRGSQIGVVYSKPILLIGYRALN